MHDIDGILATTQDALGLPNERRTPRAIRSLRIKRG